eukprot:2274343-Pyramimonas_sp.AAC.1
MSEGGRGRCSRNKNTRATQTSLPDRLPALRATPAVTTGGERGELLPRQMVLSRIGLSDKSIANALNRARTRDERIARKLKAPEIG